MQYTESEIVQSYLRSGKKSQQITILAELNADGVDDYAFRESKNNIRAILIKHGVLKETKSGRWHAEELAKRQQGQRKKLLPAVIPPKIKYFPIATPTGWHRLEGEIVGTMTMTIKNPTEKAVDILAENVNGSAETVDNDEQAAGENAEVYYYTPQDFKARFVTMANYIADCITAMDAINPDSPNADKERRAYLDEIEYVRDFLSRSRIKADDSTSD